MKLNAVTLTPLKCINTPGGDILHALKATDDTFKEFGEAYFSKIKPGAIKAWKLHKEVCLNLIVPIGEVMFVLFEPKKPNEFRVEKIGVSNYQRLTIPSNIWFGFKGLSFQQSLILSISEKPHKPDEIERMDIKQIKFDW